MMSAPSRKGCAVACYRCAADAEVPFMPQDPDARVPAMQLDQGAGAIGAGVIDNVDRRNDLTGFVRAPERMVPRSRKHGITAATEAD